MLLREGDVTTIGCPHCDSRFLVRIVTLRKTKGKRLRAIEAKRAAGHAADVAAAVARNAKLAAKLLAMPGCTCAARQDPGNSRWHSYDGGLRESRIAEYGHLFGSVAKNRGIPTEPHHDHGCPRAEDAIDYDA